MNTIQLHRYKYEKPRRARAKRGGAEQKCQARRGGAAPGAGAVQLWPSQVITFFLRGIPTRVLWGKTG